MFGTLDVAGPFELIILMVAAYFLPILVALIRKKNNLLLISLVNIFLGWTLVGWIAALVLALSKNNIITNNT